MHKLGCRRRILNPSPLSRAQGLQGAGNAFLMEICARRRSLLATLPGAAPRSRPASIPPKMRCTSSAAGSTASATKWDDKAKQIRLRWS